MKSPPKMPQRAMVRIWVASLHQELRYPMGTGVSVLPVLKKGMQGWIRTAAALAEHYQALLHTNDFYQYLTLFKELGQKQTQQQSRGRKINAMDAYFYVRHEVA